MWTVQIQRGGWKAVRFVTPMETFGEALDLLDALGRWNLGIFRAVKV